MTDYSDLMIATRAVVDPATSAADLMQIAQMQPMLRQQVAVHPNVYPALVDWLAQFGGAKSSTSTDDVRVASTAAVPTRSAPPVTPVAPPVAQPEQSTSNRARLRIPVGSPALPVAAIGLLSWAINYALIFEVRFYQSGTIASAISVLTLACVVLGYLPARCRATGFLRRSWSDAQSSASKLSELALIVFSLILAFSWVLPAVLNAVNYSWVDQETADSQALISLSGSDLSIVFVVAGILIVILLLFAATFPKLLSLLVPIAGTCFAIVLVFGWLIVPWYMLAPSVGIFNYIVPGALLIAVSIIVWAAQLSAKQRVAHALRLSAICLLVALMLVSIFQWVIAGGYVFYPEGFTIQQSTSISVLVLVCVRNIVLAGSMGVLILAMSNDPKKRYYEPPAKPAKDVTATSQPIAQAAPLYAMMAMPDGSAQLVPVAAPVYGPAAGDARSGGLATLGFFFPMIGFILFLVWRGTTPLKARSAGKGALIGVITYFVVSVGLSILLYALLGLF